MAKNNKKLFEKAIVQKRNVLNEIRKNNMSLSELRLFSIYLSKINSRDISTRLVRFPLEDFQKIIGISVGTDNITHFRNTIIKLLQQVVEIPNERGGYTAFQLFKQVEVAKDEFEQWYVEIDAHDKALPLMFDFKNRYFSYELWNALRLKSSNQIRMYEILKQYENIGQREITVTELKNLLGIHSPSKVFAQIGEYMGEGLSVGLEGETDALKNTAKKQIGQLTGIYDGLNLGMPQLNLTGKMNALRMGQSVQTITNDNRNVFNFTNYINESGAEAGDELFRQFQRRVRYSGGVL